MRWGAASYQQRGITALKTLLRAASRPHCRGLFGQPCTLLRSCFVSTVPLATVPLATVPLTKATTCPLAALCASVKLPSYPLTGFKPGEHPQSQPAPDPKSLTPPRPTTRQGARMVRELFQMARSKKACIIFFDEVRRRPPLLPCPTAAVLGVAVRPLSLAGWRCVRQAASEAPSTCPRP
jgi:hypothetical protein